MKVLVVGYGFIGHHTVDVLLSRGYEVTVLERYQDKVTRRRDDVSIVLGDIRDRELVADMCFQHQAVINLAGILGTQETIHNPFSSVQTNIVGALNVFDACAPNPEFPQATPVVQIVVGNHWMENTYSITKTTAERFARMYNRERQSRISVVRALNAYGEFQKHYPVRKIIPTFVVNALRGEPIEIYGDGEQVMDMVYVGDVAEALVRAMEQSVVSMDEVIEVGTGRPTTVKQIAEMVNEACNNSAGLVHLPMRPGEPENSVVLADTKTLRHINMHEGSLVRFEDGIKKTVEWFKECYPWQRENLK